jgi:hypothetical protein
VTVPGLYKTPSKDTVVTLESMKTSVDFLSKDLTPLFKELWDNAENIVLVKNKFKTVTQITLDLFLKPTDQTLAPHINAK